MRNSNTTPISITPLPNPNGTSPSHTDEILDKFGVAKLLALTVAQVNERVRTRAGQGRIPHHTLGPKTIRFIRSEVLQWLIQQPQNSKRGYRLSPAARKSLVQRNKQRSQQQQNEQNVTGRAA